MCERALVGKFTSLGYFSIHRIDRNDANTSAHKHASQITTFGRDISTNSIFAAVIDLLWRIQRHGIMLINVESNNNSPDKMREQTKNIEYTYSHFGEILLST